MTAVFVLPFCAVARKSRSNHAFKVNGQTLRPKKLGEKHGKAGAEMVQSLSKAVDKIDAEIRAGTYTPDQGWDQFKDHGGLLGDVLRAKGLI